MNKTPKKKYPKFNKSIPRKGQGVGGIILAALVIVAVTILFVVFAPVVHDQNLRLNGESTVGTPTGEFHPEVHKNRSLPSTITYHVEYHYVVDGKTYTGYGKTSYSYGEKTKPVDESETTTVYYSGDDASDDFIPDEKR